MEVFLVRFIGPDEASLSVSTLGGWFSFSSLAPTVLGFAVVWIGRL